MKTKESNTKAFPINILHFCSLFVQKIFRVLNILLNFGDAKHKHSTLSSWSCHSTVEFINNLSNEFLNCYSFNHNCSKWYKEEIQALETIKFTQRACTVLGRASWGNTSLTESWLQRGGKRRLEMNGSWTSDWGCWASFSHCRDQIAHILAGSCLPVILVFINLEDIKNFRSIRGGRRRESNSVHSRNLDLFSKESFRLITQSSVLYPEPENNS